MTRANVTVSTDAPTLFLSTDLGDTPALHDLQRTMTALNRLGRFAFRQARRNRRSPRQYYLESYDPTPPSVAGIPFPRKGEPDFGVRHLHMASPLEVVLTTAAGQLAPVAYAVTAMALVERAVRLLMEWQRHRAALEGRPEATATHLPPEVFEEDGETAFRLVGGDVLDDDEREQLVNALRVLASAKILQVEMSPVPEQRQES